MKTFLMIILGLFGFTALNPSHADEDLGKEQVPKAVISSFESAHPGIAPKEYEMKSFQGNPAYEIEYKEGGKEYKLLYSPDGKLLQQSMDDDD